MDSRILQTLLLFLLPLIRAGVTNRTIDDTFGDLVTGAKPTYSPDLWQHPNCGGCAIKPPLDNVFLQTYSALTYMEEKFPSMSIQFSFQGTAVYVYFILANNVNDGVTTETLSNFTLDNGDVFTYHHAPKPTPGFEFNALVYSKDNLPNKNHTLLISTSGADRHLFTSFDYANYTFDDSPATSSVSSSATQQQSSTTTPTPSGNSHPAPIGAIVGGVIGGILLLGVNIFLLLCLRRRRHESFSSYPYSVENGGETFNTRGLPPLPLTQGMLVEPQTLVAAVPNPRQTLPPVYNDSDETGSTYIASMRQAEIEDKIGGLRREMETLVGVDPSKERPPLVRPSLSFSRTRRERAYVAQIQQQMDTMRGEIEYLQAQLHSDWAQGITDEPPPSYSIVVPSEQNLHLFT